MSYPVIFLTRPWRRAILVGLITLFFVISPIVIFYTAGYRYDWKTHRVRATGIISIDVSPPDTTITLNGTPITEPVSNLPFFSRDMASYELKNRAPGTYTLSLTRAGYHTWFKDIRVESNQTTYVRDVRLIPKTLPIKLTDIEGGIRELYGSVSGRFLFLVGEDHELLHTGYIYDTATDRLDPVIRDESSIKQVTWSPLYNDLIITLGSTSTERVFLLREDNAFTPVLVHGNTTTESQTIWPHPNERERGRIFVRDGNDIMQVARNTSTLFMHVTSSAWYIDQQGGLWSVEGNKLARRTVAGVTETMPLPVDTLDSLVTAERGYVLGKKQNTFFFFSRLSDTQKEFPDGRIVHRVPETGDLIMSSGSELWHLKTDGSYSLITRLGKPIQSIITLPAFSSIATYAGDDLLTIREDDLVSTLLFTNTLSSEMYLTHGGSNISFLFHAGSSEPQVYTLPLIQ